MDVKKTNDMLKNIMIFMMFAVITSGITASIHQFTKNKIHSHIIEKNKTMLKNIFPTFLHNNIMYDRYYYINNSMLGDSLYHKCWFVKKNKKIIAMAIELLATDGYSGLIKILLGIDIYGNILGVRVISHHETPGLGDKIDIDKSPWITDFSGMHIFGIKDINFTLKKYGGKINFFTGATITPLSVVNIIKKSVISISKISFKISKFKKYDR